MKKKVIICIAAVAVVAIAVWLLTRSGNAEQLSYETTLVTKRDISNYVTATGTIEPMTEVEVGTQVSGIIDKIYVDYNSVVKKGELIAEIDKVTLESDLASAKANYEGCKAEYDYQQKNYVRSKNLHEKNLISDTDYELAVYNYEKAKSAFHSSEAEVAKAERNLSYATITSPIDGVVIERAVEAGQTVASSFETPTLFYIAADLSQMKVVADVDEADIGGVAEGQRCSFTVDAYPNDVFEGRVIQIRLGSSNSTSSTSTTSESVVTYEVVISAENPEFKLKPRLTANIFIYTIDRPNVLSVPAKALRFTPEVPLITSDDTVIDVDSPHKVWTKSGNVFTAHAVEVGISNGTYTEILSGLQEGDEIISEARFVTSQTAAPDNADTERSPFMPGPRKK